LESTSFAENGFHRVNFAVSARTIPAQFALQDAGTAFQASFSGMPSSSELGSSENNIS